MLMVMVAKPVRGERVCICLLLFSFFLVLESRKGVLRKRRHGVRVTDGDARNCEEHVAIA